MTTFVNSQSEFSSCYRIKISETRKNSQRENDVNAKIDERGFSKMSGYSNCAWTKATSFSIFTCFFSRHQSRVREPLIAFTGASTRFSSILPIELDGARLYMPAGKFSGNFGDYEGQSFRGASGHL